jgi:hypothetical protein
MSCLQVCDPRLLGTTTYPFDDQTYTMVEPGVSHRCLSSHDMNGLSEVKEGELPEDERVMLDGTVWRKLDIWILPLLTSFFLLDAVDRTSIGNARVAGLQTSLAMSNYQFSVALTVTLYITSQFPTTLLLKYVGPNLVLPAIVTLWGTVTVLQGLVTNYSGLLACRFFLGLAQGGLPPCIVLYLSCFYPRKQMQIRIATFFASASLAGAFSGLLAAAIDHLDGTGGRPGWAWIFILEGIFTFVFGIISFFLLPRSPETAHFLTKKERAYVVSALKDAGSVSENDDNDRFSWTEVVRAAKSLHVWLIAIISFLTGSIVLGVAYFEPTIVASLGYAGNQAQLMSVPPFAVTFARTYFGNRILSDIHSYLCDEISVLHLSHRVGPLPVSWIHCDILYYSGGDRLHHVLREHIEPRPLCLPFLLRHGRVLRGARTECVANKQQRTAHTTRNRGGRELLHG